MISFTLNGILRQEEADQNLLTYLREVCHLTSVKNGCAEGACGTCTVLIDGRAKKACVYKLSAMEGRSIVTLEGLSARETELYGYAFARCGAVQCGFCIPGMVMCAKGLIDRCPAPTPQQVKKAIRGNLCRCTGYVKIEKAILLAADLLAGRAVVEQDDFTGIGKPAMRVDAFDKATGKAQYCDDVFLDGSLYGKVLRSAYPRARILSIDTSRAAALPGVAAVMTATDVPGNNIDGYMVKDVPTMIPVGGVTNCVGDAVAILAAEDPDTAIRALSLIKVEYEPLPPVTDVRAAMQEDSPQVHEGKSNVLTHSHLLCGDPAEAIAAAPHKVTATVRLQGVDHAYLEPESSTAFYEGDTLVVYTTSQSVYHDKHAICSILGLSQVQLRSRYVGGAVGGKEDLHVQGFAALLCQKTHRPVKITVTRFESMSFHPKRHPMEITYTLASDEAGNFLAASAEIYADTGAYASLGPAVIGRACTHTGGPYRLAHGFAVEGYAVYTNNPPYGAFRGFGVAQISFANETTIDLLAEELGRDKLELRMQNALRPGDVMPTGQLCGSDVGFLETLQAIEAPYREALAAGKHVGVSGALKNVGLGSGLDDAGRAKLEVRGGKVLLYTSAQCLGQGLSTTMIQIASEATGLPHARFEAILPNTETTPDSGASTASRQTTITGEAVRMAAVKLREALDAHTLAELEGQVFLATHDPHTDPIGAPGVKYPRSQICYGYAANLVVLAEDGTVEKIYAAHDVGRCINRLNVEGQIEGGVVMSMGYALTEDFPLRDGFLQNRKFGMLGLFRATEVPPIEITIIEKSTDPLTYGAKGVGEIATIPTAAALAAAYRSRNGYFQYALPLKDTPYARKK